MSHDLTWSYIERVMWHYGWKPLTVNQQLVMTGGYWSSVNADIEYFICHATLKIRMIKGSCHAMGGSSSLYVTTLYFVFFFFSFLSVFLNGEAKVFKSFLLFPRTRVNNSGIVTLNTLENICVKNILWIWNFVCESMISCVLEKIVMVEVREIV